MSILDNQVRNLLRLLAELRPHWRTDRALPARIQALLAGNRAFGSRDRRLYRELIYTVLRYLPWFETRLEANPEGAVAAMAALAGESPATTAFRASLNIEHPTPNTQHPRPKTQGAGAELPRLIDGLPPWFRNHCPALFESPNLEAVMRRAPLWLRAQGAAPREIVMELATAGIRARQSAVLESAIEVLDEANVTSTELFKRGGFEVQDLGSQLVLASLGIPRGGIWLDACAGAGGKTLQLATLLGDTGQVDAHDVRGAALIELKARAARAGMTVQPGARIRIPRELEAAYDGVLVDAPCSGSGTWRRAPHLKWSTTPETVEAAAELQFKLLREFGGRVRPGGWLVYATCSLSRRENEEVVARFLTANPVFTEAAPARTIMPAEFDTDGFFVACLRR